MINSNDKQALINFLQNTEYKKSNDLNVSSEYREKFNGDRLFEKTET